MKCCNRTLFACAINYLRKRLAKSQICSSYSIAFLILSTALPVAADGPVWKVSKAGQHLYVGGTIHLLSKDDYPLPATLQTGYQQADVLVFEVDPDVAKSAAAQQLFAQYALYRDGRDLASVLQPATYSQLEQFLVRRGLNIESFKRYKPGMLTLVLTVIELQRLGMAGEGVDEFYYQRAKTDQKPRVFLESLQEQFDALLTTGEGNEDEMILQTLEELDNMIEVMRLTKVAWRKGDNAALVAVSLAPWKDEFPELYQALLVKRNQKWLPQIEAMLQTPEVEYILVGALHLAGPDGLLALLQDKGYHIEHLKVAK